MKRIEGRGAARIAYLAGYHPSGEPETAKRATGDLVVVAEFRDPIYPGLRSTGTVERGGDRPFHTVINGENYHALEALMFAYEGKVDCTNFDRPYTRIWGLERATITWSLAELANTPACYHRR